MRKFAGNWKNFTELKVDRNMAKFTFMKNNVGFCAILGTSL